MKTLLSLTSRRFWMTWVRVFFQLEWSQKLPEWVSINKSQRIIVCTRDALSTLGDWCSKTARVFWLTMIVTTWANNALAQDTQGKSDNISSWTVVATSPVTITEWAPSAWSNVKPLNFIADRQSETPDAVWSFTTEQITVMVGQPNSPKTFRALSFLSDKWLDTISRIVAVGWQRDDPETKSYDQLNQGDDKFPELLGLVLTQVGTWIQLARETSSVLERTITSEDLLNIAQLSDTDRAKIAEAPNKLNRRITKFIIQEWEVAKIQIAQADARISVGEATIAQADSRIAQARAESAQARAESASYQLLLTMLSGFKKS